MNKLISSYLSENTINFSEFYSTSISSDLKKINHRNNIEKELKQFESRFLSFLKYDDIPIDYTSNIEKELVILLKKNRETCVNWLSDKIIEYYENNRVLLNLLKLIGNIDGTLGAISYFIFGTTLSHQNVEIKEFALRIQEKWQSPRYHQILKNAKMHPKWLDDYRAEIVNDFEELNV